LSESNPPPGQVPPGWGQQPAYPQQTLLPQQVQRGRSRKPLVVGLVIALIVAVGGIVAWQLLKDNGEQTRTAYCSALRRLTHNGDLTTALSGANVSTLAQLANVQKLAPDAVRGDWTTLQSLASSAQSGQIDASSAIKALTSLQAIADDAKSKCAITINIPNLP
jgi:predicted negative regulator of RcsB-dependent stress response